jgi:hypothetical protein
MRFAIITAATAALASLAAANSASAQVGFGVYVGPSGYYDDYDYAPPPPRTRVYGYTSTYDYDSRPDIVVRAPGRRGGCGEFFYWNGTHCVDARTNPPDLR